MAMKNMEYTKLEYIMINNDIPTAICNCDLFNNKNYIRNFIVKMPRS